MKTAPLRRAGNLRLVFAAGLTLCATSLIASAALYFVWTWHWPLVGDASLIHYIAFLIERGWAPYRTLGDMNMPGSFLIELAAMHLFGAGALAWRLFDFALVLAASAALFVLTGHSPGATSQTVSASDAGWYGSNEPQASSLAVTSAWINRNLSHLPALFAASLFLLIHGRDGLAQGGQRDLTMAVSLLGATASLFVAVRRDLPWVSAAFGLLSGIAFTIKPTALPLSLVHLLLAVIVLRSRGKRWAVHVILTAAAALFGPAIALLFLLREHALAAFLAGFHGIVPYYASLGHRPVGYILLHSVSPILSLVLIWFAVLALRKPLATSFARRWERTALLAGVLFGVVNCLIQARALPYYRYPLLAFLLPLMVLDFTAASEPQPESDVRYKAAGALGLLALALGSLFLAPQSAILLHRFRWQQTDFISSLTQNLSALGGPALSHRVQCIDSVSGCGTALYNLRLEPATGVLSDFLLFGPSSIPIVRQTREQFSAALVADPPQVIVVTSHLHIDGPDSYLKLERWPAFTAFLAAKYIVATEWTPTRTNRWWSREELPAGYRIYLLRTLERPGTHIDTFSNAGMPTNSQRIGVH